MLCRVMSCLSTRSGFARAIRRCPQPVRRLQARVLRDVQDCEERFHRVSQENTAGFLVPNDADAAWDGDATQMTVTGKTIKENLEALPGRRCFLCSIRVWCSHRRWDVWCDVRYGGGRMSGTEGAGCPVLRPVLRGRNSVPGLTDGQKIILPVEAPIKKTGTPSPICYSHPTACPLRTRPTCYNRPTPCPVRTGLSATRALRQVWLTNACAWYQGTCRSCTATSPLKARSPRSPARRSTCLIPNPTLAAHPKSASCLSPIAAVLLPLSMCTSNLLSVCVRVTLRARDRDGRWCGAEK